MKTIEDPLSLNSKEAKGEPALINQHCTISYESFNRYVNLTKQFYSDQGIQPSNRIAFYSPNSIEYIVQIYALWRLGAVSCLFNHRLPKEIIKKRSGDLGCQSIFTADSMDVVSNIVSGFEREFASSPANKPLVLDQNCTILFTSGSQGKAKAVLHTLGNHYYSAKGSNEHIPFKKGDRWALTLPLYHVGGLSIVFRALLAQACVVLPSDKDTLKDAVNNSGVTHISLVPTQLMRLIHTKENIDALKKKKAILVGGSPIPETLLKYIHQYKLPVYITYGLTEMASQVATSNSNQQNVMPLKHRELRVDQNAQICVKGKTLFNGYVKGEQTILPVDKDGWFLTGDLGQYDEKKGLAVWGRKDNMFISGGENIQPEEIENYLYQMDSVEEALVVPVKHEEYGMRPVAFVKSNENKVCKREECVQFLKQHLPNFKIPDQFYSWPQEKDKQSLKTSRKHLQLLVQSRNFTFDELS